MENKNETESGQAAAGELTKLDKGALAAFRIVSGAGAAALGYGLCVSAVPAIVIGACILTVASPLQVLAEVKAIKAKKPKM